MTARGLVDVLIPRGGADLIRSVVDGSTVPVIETGVGNCHVYVDDGADLDMALEILLNAKTSRPSVCNAAESLLVHASVAPTFLARALPALDAAGVTVHGSPAVVSSGTSVGVTVPSRRPTTTSAASICRWTCRLAWSTRSTRRSTTSGASAPGTRRRS